MGNYNDFDLDIKKVQGENDIGPASITTTIKYSLQGTTQSRYLTGGSARQIFHVMFKLSLVAAMVVIIKSTTRRLSSKDTFSQVSR